MEGENVEATETEVKAGGGVDGGAEGGAGGGELCWRRKRANFSKSFKASVLAAYTSDGPAQAARQFGVSQVESDVERFT